MSINNIIVTADFEPIKKYAKAIPSKIAGRRLDPSNNREVPFVLASASNGEFEYENDVIELYTEKEVKFFAHANRYFIKEGYLKEYVGEAKPIDTRNIMSDEDVEHIASLRTTATLSKRLSDITSRVAVQRVLDMATHIGRPAPVIKIIEKRLEELS